MPAVSSTLQSQIIEHQRSGMPISMIAKTLGVSRQTVYNHLTPLDNWESYLKDKSSNINRLALNAVERAVQRGNAQVALRWLEHTIFAPTAGDSYHIHGDVSLTQAIGYVPSPSGTLVTTGQPSTPVSTGTEAAAKPTGNDISVSNHTNFSQFSDEQLEQELARRRAARSGVIDAEVVDAGR
jgi:AcrR family transcriptional regulator